MSAERRADAFAQAISGKDEAAAQAQCTPRGWSADQDTPGSLYKQAVRKGLFLGAGVVLAEQDGRTAIAVPLLRVDQAGEEHILAGLHLLDTGSGLAGLTKNAQVAHLFVEGAISAPPSFEALPESKEAWTSSGFWCRLSTNAMCRCWQTPPPTHWSPCDCYDSLHTTSSRASP